MTVSGSSGRYQFTSRIATGGMGEVWRAQDTVLDREVAVKVLKHEYADDPVFRSRFETEARNAAALHHPNVASVFDFGHLPDDDGSGTQRPFLVMELVPGQPLSALLRGGEAMPPDRAAQVVAQAADAVAAAHAIDIVHRDVKPANMLVTPDGTVKITDFGIARAADAAGVTQTGQIVGTPHYISPEQAEGRPATKASDIYALGVVLYECLAGRRPFERDTPIQVALAHLREPVPPLGEDVPERMRVIVEKALAKDPADRFSSAADLATALRGGEVAGLGKVGAAGLAAGAAGAAGLGAGAAGAATDDEGTRILDQPPPSTAATSPADTDDRRRGLPPWWPWAAAAAAVLAIVVLAAALAGNGQEPTSAASPTPSAAASETASKAPSKSPSPSPSPTPTKEPDDRIPVREEDYLGRDKKEVQTELETLGFEVKEEKVPASSPDQVKDTVADVSPSGQVDPGSTITMQVFEEYKADGGGNTGGDDEPGKSDGKGKKDG